MHLPVHYASPQAQLRQRVLGELRWQSTRGGFDLSLAAERLRADRTEILGVLSILRGLGLVAFQPDAGWILANAATEVA